MYCWSNIVLCNINTFLCLIFFPSYVFFFFQFLFCWFVIDMGLQVFKKYKYVFHTHMCKWSHIMHANVTDYIRLSNRLQHTIINKWSRWTVEGVLSFISCEYVYIWLFYFNRAWKIQLPIIMNPLKIYLYKLWNAFLQFLIIHN